MLSRFALVAIIAAGITAQAGLAKAEPVKAVLELFTSQGCSSCPPADRLLGELSREEGIVALSFPVDYWDYLGWADTLGSPENSARQRAYAAARGDRAVYTPQLVINGRAHEIGSDERSVRHLISTQTANAAAPAISLELSAKSDQLAVSIPAGDLPQNGDATLWLVTFEKSRTVEIARGENRGRKITYHNVVSKMQPIGMWKGEAVEIILPRSEVMRDGIDGCAVLLQQGSGGHPGPILGAAILSQL